MARDELTAAPRAQRRDVLRAGGVLAAGATLGATGVSLGANGAEAAATPTGRARIALTRTRAAGIHAAEIDLAVRSRGAWTSPPLSADDFALLGFSWPSHAPTPVIEARYRSSGTWQAWRTLPVLDDRPDPDDQASLRHATQPLWVGSADGVQARVSGHRPARVLLSLIRPDEAPGDAATTASAPLARASTAPRRRATPGTVARPRIWRRTDWSADESWRDGRPSYNTTIQQVHVHHTVSGNDYTRRETPGLIRGMYYYHTHTLGWSDIGYNFLVDRFGRIWEGRAGGVGKAVRGAHTLGFNATSCGVSVIGNLDVTQPSVATIAAISRLAAWKLARYGRDPLGTTSVVSEGSDKFQRNRVVTLPVIDGHRDTNDTACPGRYLYAHLDEIRQDTRALIDAATVTSIVITEPFTLTGDPTPGSVLAVSGGAFTPPEATATYAWLRDGVAIRRAVKPVRRLTDADAGHLISAVVTLSAEGCEPVSQRIDATGPVRALPTIDVAVSNVGDDLTVEVTVTATGVADPGGTASIGIDGAVQVVPVVAGHASARVVALPGTHQVEVGYSGSDVVAPGSASATYAMAR